MQFYRKSFTALMISALAWSGYTLAADVARTPEVVATIPSSAFNENITEDDDGTFYVTGAFEGNLWKISLGGKVEKLAHYDTHPIVLGIVALPDSLVMGGFRRTFFLPGGGVDFSDVGAEILILDKKTGKIVTAVPGQKGQVFNGMVADGRGKILTTDSLGSSVWQFDPATRKLELWLKDEALASSGPKSLGANGIKVAGDWVYIANKEKLSIVRVRIDANGKAQGPVALVAKELPGADDFAVAPDGTVYLPPADQTKPSPMTRITTKGEKSTYVMAPFGASAMVSRDGKWVYWATASGPDPQKLLRIAIP